MENYNEEKKGFSLEMYRDSNFSYRVLTREDEDEVYVLLMESFKTNQIRHAFCQNSDQNEHQFIEGHSIVVKSLLEECMTNGLSTTALDLKTEKVVGVCMIKDYAGSCESTSHPSTNKFNVMLEGIEHQLWQQFQHPFKKLTHQKGCIADATLLGVHPEYQDKKVGVKLAELTMRNIQNHGFRYIYGFAAHPASQIICTVLGFKTLASMPACQYEVAGERPLRKLTKKWEIKLMLLNLIVYPSL